MRQSPGSGTHPLLLELTHSLVKLMNAFAASDASCQERSTMPIFSLRLSSAQVSLILCSEPVFTAIVSFVLLAEALSGAGLAGTGIIIGCIVAETYILSSDAAASPQKTPEGAV